MLEQPDVAPSASQEYRLVPIDELVLHPDNTRRGDVDHIVESIRRRGFYGAVGRQRSTGYLVWGNHRYQAAQIARTRIAQVAAGEFVGPDDEAFEWRLWPMRFGTLETIPVIDLDLTDEEALDLLLDDNVSSDRAGWDEARLAVILGGIAERRGSLAGTGFDRPDLARMIRAAEPVTTTAPGVPLEDRFLVPPFSILDARSGRWQDRRRAWLDLGLRSEEGRDDALALPSLSGRIPDYYAQKTAIEERLGRKLTNPEFEAGYLVEAETSGVSSGGTSVFDPVLAELAVRWFCPPAGLVLDPCAGGSVRGIVSARLGRDYLGLDISARQVEANEAALELADGYPTPRWEIADGRTVGAGPEDADLILTCPPYWNLEVYSDDPDDLSAAPTWEAFLDGYRELLAGAAARLRPGRFAVYVVGNLRDRTGRILDLVAETVAGSEAAGLVFYNELVYVSPLGSVPMRAGRQFAVGRKVGRAHQEVVVLLKPPLEDALAALGDIDPADFDLGDE